MSLVQLLFQEYKNPEIPTGVLRTPSMPATQPLTLDGQPNRASLCLTTFYRLRLKVKSATDPPSAKRQGWCFPKCLPASLLLELQPWGTVLKFLINKQRQDWFHLGQYTGEGRRGEKCSESHLSLDLTPTHIPMMSPFSCCCWKIFFNPLVTHTHYRLPGDSYKILLLFFVLF